MTQLIKEHIPQVVWVYSVVNIERIKILHYEKCLNVLRIGPFRALSELFLLIYI